MENTYYTQNIDRFLSDYRKVSEYWLDECAVTHGAGLSSHTRDDATRLFRELVLGLPYVGGNDSQRTRWLIDSSGYLSFYLALRSVLPTPEIGRILYFGTLQRQRDQSAQPVTISAFTPEEVKAFRKHQSQESHQRRYEGDYVYQYVDGQHEVFEYGYDFAECGAQKLFRRYNAWEFLPYYCHIDHAKVVNTGYRLQRSECLSLGDHRCSHRFIPCESSEGELWPPEFPQKAP